MQMIVFGFVPAGKDATKNILSPKGDIVKDVCTAKERTRTGSIREGSSHCTCMKINYTKTINKQPDKIDLNHEVCLKIQCF